MISVQKRTKNKHQYSCESDISRLTSRHELTTFYLEFLSSKFPTALFHTGLILCLSHITPWIELLEVLQGTSVQSVLRLQ